MLSAETEAHSKNTPQRHVKPARVLSIDILRGLTIALMILVNDPGDGAVAYTQLDHAAWNGLTLTDLVFPTFLFLVGCAIVLSSFARAASGASRRTLALHVVRRSAGILFIGWALNLLPYFHFTQLRYYGVLPRIALCYLVAGLLFIWIKKPTALAGIVVLLLVGYWVIMRFIPVPGAGHPVTDIPILDPDNNLVAWLDRHINAFTQHWLHTGRLYEKTRDPEGLISTLPAVATTLLGMLTALWMRSARPAATKAISMAAAGALFIAAGTLWNPWFPVNKKLWTSSYVLAAAGIALVVLALLYWLVDIRRVQDHSRTSAALLWPWRVFGSNAIAAYIAADLLGMVLHLIHMGTMPNGRPLTLGHWSYAHLFASGGSTSNTSVAYAVVYVALCFLPIWILWRRKIFLKI